MKSFEAIVEEIKRKSEFDLCGTTSDLMEYLPYQYAKEFLKPEVTEEEWKKSQVALTEENVVSVMKNYMAFALDKASNHRGISTSRSIEHFACWLSLLEDSETLSFLEDEDNYENYGCPILKKICEKYGFSYPEDLPMQNMAKGLPCWPDCEEGCGH